MLDLNRQTKLLFQACRDGSASELWRLVADEQVDPNCRDFDAETPLIVASRYGHCHIVQFLLNNGADIHAKNKRDETALHVSCESGQMKCTQLLLDNHADIHAKDTKDCTPLHSSCNLRILSFRLRPGITLGELVVQHDDEQLETVAFLLENGANINAQDTNKETPLHIACEIGLVKVAELLLKHGADSSLKNKSNKTALDVAIKSHPANRSRVAAFKQVFARQKKLLKYSKSVKATKQPPTVARSPSIPIQSTSKNVVKQAAMTINSTNDLVKVVPKLSEIELVIEELLRTESNYISDLHSLIKFYITPFEDPKNGKEILVRLRGNSMTIFGNIRELHNFHDMHMFPGLMRSHKFPGQLCRIFIKNKDALFGHYVQYCNRILPRSQKLCQEQQADSSKFFLRCQKQAGHKLPLSSYLMAPFQRIQKYPLLLEKLQGACNEDPQITSLVRDTVGEALAFMTKLVARINASTEKENQELRDQLTTSLFKNLQFMEIDKWMDKEVLLESDVGNHAERNEASDPDRPSSSRAEENKCTICLYQKVNKTIVIRCGHTFCYDCIKTHNNISDICPNCNGRIESLLKVYE